MNKTNEPHSFPYRGKHLVHSPIVPPTHRYPPAPPRHRLNGSFLGKYLERKTDEIVRPSCYGEDIGERMELSERLIHAGAAIAGSLPDEEREALDVAIRAERWNFWAGVRSYLAVYYMLNESAIHG